MSQQKNINPTSDGYVEYRNIFPQNQQEGNKSIKKWVEDTKRKMEVNEQLKDAHCDWCLDLERYKKLFHTHMTTKNY